MTTNPDLREWYDWAGQLADHTCQHTLEFYAREMHLLLNEAPTPETLDRLNRFALRLAACYLSVTYRQQNYGVLK